MSKVLDGSRLLDQVRTLATVKPDVTILLDGRSGSGKSSIADKLVQALAGEYPLELISLEDLYAGWEGLRHGHDTLVELLQNKQDGIPSSYQSYDWLRKRFSSERVLNAEAVWLVEGCGAISAESVKLADLSIWIETPDEVRQTRIGKRDPDFQRWWQAWNSQHDAFIAEHNSPEIASATFVNV